MHAFSFGEERLLVKCLFDRVARGTAVLFKASRKTALERVIKELGREE